MKNNFASVYDIRRNKYQKLSVVSHASDKIIRDNDELSDSLSEFDKILCWKCNVMK